MNLADDRIRVRRSALFMPGANARALEKARELPADVVIMDLEDAVAPESKALARQRVAEALGAGGYGHRELLVRVNPAASDWYAEDVRAVAQLPLHGVVVPKVEHPAEIHRLVRDLDDAGAPAHVAVWCMIETPLGVLRAEAICGASERLACLLLGTSDLAKELRARPGTDRAELLPALSLCVLAARAHGLDVLDGVHLALADEPGLRRACAQARALGFDGKTLIHPRQIEPCNEAFAPTTEALAHARRVIDAWERALAQGDGVTVVDGRLVENLHVEEARRALALAAASQVGAA